MPPMALLLLPLLLLLLMLLLLLLLLLGGPPLALLLGGPPLALGGPPLAPLLGNPRRRGAPSRWRLPPASQLQEMGGVVGTTTRPTCARRARRCGGCCARTAS